MSQPRQRAREPETKGEAPQKRRTSLSMHEGKAIWCDCCSCEAEERWAALAGEMGIDLSDEATEEDPSQQ